MRLSPGVLCWSVVAGAAVVHALGAVSDALVLAAQATAVALAALAGIVLLGSGRGRLAVAAGIGVLAVDAAISAQDSGEPQYLPPASATFWIDHPYSIGEDVAWLGEGLLAQLTQHWPALLGILLICGGTVVTLAARPRVDARWLRWVAWVAVLGVVAILLNDVGGARPARWLVTLGAQLPTIVAAAAALTVLVVAAGRQRRFGVPAMLGALLLSSAVLSAELAAVAPARPVVLDELHSVADKPGYYLQPGYRTEVASAVAVGQASPGSVTAPLLALVPVVAIALLVLASAPWGSALRRRDDSHGGERGMQPGDGDDRRGHDEGPDREGN